MLEKTRPNLPATSVSWLYIKTSGDCQRRLLSFIEDREWRAPAKAVKYLSDRRGVLAGMSACRFLDSSMKDGIGRLGDIQGHWT